MVVESFACPVCAEQIAPGRLSCPQCGTVLAAVARSWRSDPAPRDPAPAVARPSAPSWLDAVTAPGPAVPVEEAAEPWTGRSDDGWDVEPEAGETLDPGTAPLPTPVAALLDAAPDAWRSSPQPEWSDDSAWDHPETRVEPEADASLEAEFALDAEPEPASPEDPVAASVAPDTASFEPPATTEPGPMPSLLRPASSRPNPFLVDAPIPDVLPPVAPAPADPVTAPAPTAAAYVPPSVAAPGSLDTSATDDAPARILPRAWDPSGATLDRAAAPAAAPADALAALRGRLALPGIDRARIDEAAGVVVLAGAMGSLIGFLLPWSRVVIGSRGAGTYFDTWGLASQGHLVVFLLVLGALALAAIPNRIDTWLRTGVVGIALGALLLGLAWPYAFGPLGAGVGIVLLVVAACLLLLGGLVSTLVQRHGVETPGV